MILMSNEYTDALKLIAQNSNLWNCVGPIPDQVVARAESKLGCAFPPEYRDFLLRFGCGSFGSFEVYGIVGSDIEVACVPNGVWLTQDEQNNGCIPTDKIILASLGNGEYYTINCGTEENGIISIVHPSADPEYYSEEKLHPNLGAFLMEQLTWQLEDAK